ncbi:MAG TPA: hypothetical protein VGF89_01095 [Steroidobacteraceae bacterium]|jgi:hypothetical protein
MARRVGSLKISVSPRLRSYLDRLVAIQGYGSDRQKVAERFVWDGVHRLLEAGVLKERGP